MWRRSLVIPLISRRNPGLSTIAAERKMGEAASRLAGRNRSNHFHPSLITMNRLSLISRPAASRLFACGQANTMAVRRFSEDINPLRLFVGGLSWKTDENKIRDAFQPFGEVGHGTCPASAIQDEFSVIPI
jgi:hypothetical protein